LINIEEIVHVREKIVSALKCHEVQVILILSKSIYIKIEYVLPKVIITSSINSPFIISDERKKMGETPRLVFISPLSLPLLLTVYAGRDQ
jgi:hypothetical protein